MPIGQQNAPRRCLNTDAALTLTVIRPPVGLPGFYHGTGTPSKAEPLTVEVGGFGVWGAQQ